MILQLHAEVADFVQLLGELFGQGWLVVPFLLELITNPVKIVAFIPFYVPPLLFIMCKAYRNLDYGLALVVVL